MKATRTLLALAVLAFPVLSWAEVDLMGGASFAFADPQGDFDAAAGTGIGLEAFAVIAPKGKPFGLRVDGSYLTYGSESFVTPFPGTGGRVGVEVSTDNWIAHMGAGPEFAVRTGPVRPFVFGTAGFSYFATTSNLSDDFGSYAYTTNYDDWTFRWSVGGGLNIPISKSVALSVGAAWVANDDVTYLVEGDVLDDGNGGIAFNPRHTDANLIQYTIGVSGGF